MYINDRLEAFRTLKNWLTCKDRLIIESRVPDPNVGRRCSGRRDSTPMRHHAQSALLGLDACQRLRPRRGLGNCCEPWPGVLRLSLSLSFDRSGRRASVGLRAVLPDMPPFPTVVALSAFSTGRTCDLWRRSLLGVLWRGWRQSSVSWICSPLSFSLSFPVAFAALSLAFASFSSFAHRR